MSDATPEPLDPNFQLSLGGFEGPLDLLLHLIKKHELDILDLPIAFVTERYLQYVSMMEQLNLDVASEYLVMAATLAHIKSKMLLPQQPDDQDEEELEDEVDPRAELIRRLLEYQKYKHAAQALGARGIVGRDVFGRGSEAPSASGPPPLAGTSLFALLDAFNQVLTRAKAEFKFEVTTEGISIQERMRQLTERMRQSRQLSFEQLFEGQASVYDLVVTFLALLEMAKRRLVRIYQADPHSPIHLRSTVLSEEETAESEWTTETPWETARTEESAALDSAGDAVEGEKPSGSEREADSTAGEPRRFGTPVRPSADDPAGGSGSTARSLPPRYGLQRGVGASRPVLLGGGRRLPALTRRVVGLPSFSTRVKALAASLASLDAARSRMPPAASALDRAGSFGMESDPIAKRPDTERPDEEDAPT